MDQNLEQKCIICDESKADGEGIRIISGFICCNCEEEMVRTDVKDAKYPFFIKQMRQFFMKA